MKYAAYLAPASLFAMIASVFGLRWTHNDVWFLIAVLSLVLFSLSLGDLIKRKYRKNTKTRIPASVHVLSAILFICGVAASIFGIGNPDYETLDLILAPFIMSACVYVAFFFIVISRGIKS